jgi:SAM-dependent methyltransferase
MKRREFLSALAAASVPLPSFTFAAQAHAQDFPNPAGDDLYKPSVGQAGKDVVWVPTPDDMVRQMLDKAKVGRDDLVFDLGCGDGKIPIAAARLHGATAKGIEYNPEMAALARRNVERANVKDKVEIITGDIFDPALQARFMQANVITAYLLPDLNLRLRPSLLKMKPGTRVVTHAFHMGEWEPDDTFTVEGRDGFYWIVPANVAGRWNLKDDDGWEGTLELSQRFQRVGGTLTQKGKTQTLLGPYVNGETLGFTFVDLENNVRSARTTVKDNGLVGAVRFGRAQVGSIRGDRKPS